MARTTRRRFALGVLGVGGGASLLAWFQRNSIIRWMLSFVQNDALVMSAAPAIGQDACILTASQVEGPFFIGSPLRRDIKEDRQGKEMTLRIEVVRMPECAPIEDALVEIWHCDAEGAYSGYPEDMGHDPWKTIRVAGLGAAHVEPTTEARFLRGAQRTDAAGVVEFDTIFPGWYEPRSPHVHFKVLVDDREYLTSQFYFAPEFCNRMYLHLAPYSTYGESPYRPENDPAMMANQDARGLLLNPVWDDLGPVQASARVGVQRPA